MGFFVCEKSGEISLGVKRDSGCLGIFEQKLKSRSTWKNTRTLKAIAKVLSSFYYLRVTVSILFQQESKKIRELL